MNTHVSSRVQTPGKIKLMLRVKGRKVKVEFILIHFYANKKY